MNSPFVFFCLLWLISILYFLFVFFFFNLFLWFFLFFVNFCLLFFYFLLFLSVVVDYRLRVNLDILTKKQSRDWKYIYTISGPCPLCTITWRETEGSLYWGSFVSFLRANVKVLTFPGSNTCLNLPNKLQHSIIM